MESTYKPTRPQFPSLGIYALHAGDLEYRYVGTSKNIRARLTEHRSRARRGHAAPVYRWMREVGPENVQVVILQAISDPSKAAIEEAAWIAKVLALGFDLLNEDGRNGVPYSKSERGLKNLRKGARATSANARPCVFEGVEYASIHAASKATGVYYNKVAKLAVMR